MTALTPYLTMIVAALVILATLIAVLLVVRTLSRGVRGRKGARLGISEYHEIDKSRRLVLVRRDDVEHLMLIGGPQDVVIESGIESALMAAPSLPVSAPSLSTQSATGALTGSNIQPLPMRPPPRPAIFGERRPPLRSVDPVANLRHDDEA
jgi:hypothetical protein